MTKAVLNIKTDPQTKQQIQEFAAELGLPVSVIMNAQLKQMLRDRKVVFSTALEPTTYLEKIMNQVEVDLAEGKNITRTKNVKGALDHLRSL